MCRVSNTILLFYSVEDLACPLRASSAIHVASKTPLSRLVVAQRFSETFVKLCALVTLALAIVLKLGKPVSWAVALLAEKTEAFTVCETGTEWATLGEGCTVSKAAYLVFSCLMATACSLGCSSVACSGLLSQSQAPKSGLRCPTWSSDWAARPAPAPRGPPISETASRLHK